MSESGGLRARNLRTVAALAALFLLPLALAFCAYYAGWRPAGSVNHGTLISPPRPLPALVLPRHGAAPAAAETFRGSWTLVYLGEGSRCDADCERALLVMRQTRLSLNNDMTRVGRVWLATGQCCAPGLRASPDPGLIVLDATGPAAAPLLAQFPVDGRAHSLYVVDPLGNLMMSYDDRRDPHGLLEDLRKLLRLSHIG